MPITQLDLNEKRSLTHLRQALEVVLAHDGETLVSDIVSLLYITMSDEPLTVRKLGVDLLGRSHSTGNRAMNRLQKEYHQNGRHFAGLNLIQRSGNQGHFRLTHKGEAVVRSLLALLAK